MVLVYQYLKVLLILIISDPSLPKAVYFPMMQKTVHSVCGTKILHCVLPLNLGMQENMWRREMGVTTVWKRNLKVDLRSQKIELYKPNRTFGIFPSV